MFYLCIDFLLGCLTLQAEIILIEPAPDNAGEGILEKTNRGGFKTLNNLPEFNLKKIILMKIKLLSALLILMPFISMAQYRIKGKVIDAQSGIGLQGAHLSLNNRLITVTTDEKGKFEISNLKAGFYKMRVTYVGFKTWESLFDLAENKAMLISMEQKPVVTETAIITASRAGDKTPVAYQNLDRAEIVKSDQGRDVPFLLDQMPATVVTSDAGAGVGYTGIRIRGTDMNRINITVNGIPLNDAESHSVFWVNMPDFSSSVSSLQVQRGVGTSTNGAAAFGASINLETTTPPRDAYADITNAAGSFNTWKHTVSAGTGLISSRWAFDMRLSKLSSDGFIDRASSSLKSFYVSGGYYGINTIVKVNIFSGYEKTYQAWDGIPSTILDTNRTWNGIGQYTDQNGKVQYYANETDNYQQDHYQLQFVQHLTNNLTLHAALHLTKGFGYYEQYKEDQQLVDYLIAPVLIPGPDSVTIRESDLIRRKYLDNDFYGLVWSLNYTKDKLNLVAGGSVNRYDGKHFGEVIWAAFSETAGYNHRWYNGTGDKRDFNVYTRGEYQLNKKWNLYADLQLRNINYTIAGTDDDQRMLDQSHNFNFFNPKAGLYYTVSNKSGAYLSAAVGHREPNRDNFTDASPNGTAPSAETLYDFETGYHVSNKNVIVSANIYYMYYRDQLVLTGKINDVGAAVMSNVPKSYRSGIEFTAQWKPIDRLAFKGNLALSKNIISNFTEYVDDWDNWGSQIENKLGNTQISFSPAIVTAAAVIFTIRQGYEIEWNCKYVSKQYIDNTASADRMLNPYFVNNLRLSTSIDPAFANGLLFNVFVNNVFNTEYETNAWVYRYYSEGRYGSLDGYFPQAGINFMAGFTLKL